MDLRKQGQHLLFVTAEEQEKHQFVDVLVRAWAGDHPLHLLVDLWAAEELDMPVEIAPPGITAIDEREHECSPERQEGENDISYEAATTVARCYVQTELEVARKADSQVRLSQ